MSVMVASNFSDVGIFLAAILRKRSGLLALVLERCKSVYQQVLSVHQVVELKALLRLPMATFRRMRILFSKFGFKIFPSEPKMRVEISSRIAYLKDAQMESVDMLLEDNCNGNPLKSIPVLISKNLSAYIAAVFRNLKGGSDFYSDKDSILKVVIGGDKGGDTMKFHFMICHPGTSVFDAHVFGMYSGSDGEGNMHRVIEHQFVAMCNPDFRIAGHRVEFFLSGDFKFLDCVTGHQGSSATRTT